MIIMQVSKQHIRKRKIQLLYKKIETSFPRTEVFIHPKQVFIQKNLTFSTPPLDCDSSNPRIPEMAANFLVGNDSAWTSLQAAGTGHTPCNEYQLLLFDPGSQHCFLQPDTWQIPHTENPHQITALFLSFRIWMNDILLRMQQRFISLQTQQTLSGNNVVTMQIPELAQASRVER